eukprot:265082-Chlamydomonas_euryale.AAC.1
MSSTGQYITIVSNDVLTVSSDFGGSFAEVSASLSSSRNLRDVAISSNGATQTVVAGAVGEQGSIYVSTNSGATWTASTSGIPDLATYFNNIAMSADGSVQTVLTQTGFIYVSSDSGASWTQKTTLGTAEWTSVAMSSTGAIQLVSRSGNNLPSEQSLLQSTDSGSTFNA